MKKSFILLTAVMIGCLSAGAQEQQQTKETETQKTEQQTNAKETDVYYYYYLPCISDVRRGAGVQLP